MDKIRVTIRWADEKERTRAEEALLKLQISELSRTHGRIEAVVSKDELSRLEETKLACQYVSEVVETMSPILAQRASRVAAAASRIPDRLRELYSRSQQVKSELWESVRMRVDIQDLRSIAFGAAPESLADNRDVLEEDYYLVQLREPLTPEGRQQLAERKLSWVPHRSPARLLMSLSRGELQDVQQLSFVENVQRFGTQDTLTPSMSRFFDEDAKQDPERLMEFDLLLHRVEDQTQIREFLVNQGGVEIVKEGRRSPTLRVRMAAGSPTLAVLARLPQVRTMAPFTPPTLEVDVAAGLIGSGTVGVAPKFPSWTGKDVVVAIFDSGIDANHPDLAPAIQHATYYGQGSAVDTEGHGTHVAGIVAGRGKVVRGIAPESKILSYGIVDANGKLDVPTDLGELLTEAVELGASIINLSWKTQLSNDYSMYGMTLDKFARENPDVLVVVAAGNQGKSSRSPTDNRCLHDPYTIGNPAAAKNVVTVGACRSNRPTFQGTFKDLIRFPDVPVSTRRVAETPHIPAAFSSRGPTSFDSAKPDLVAPGTLIASTRPAAAKTQFILNHPLPTDPATGQPVSNTQYGYLSGTSMAAPVVAGAAAVLREYLVDVHQKQDPTSALLKALLLLATAREPTACDDSHMNLAAVGVPDFDQGYGCLDLHQLLPHAAAPAQRKLWFDDVRNNSKEALEAGVPDGGPGQAFRGYPFTVIAQAGVKVPLRLALVWADVPGPAIFNRLILRLRRPDDSNVYGNASHLIFAPQFSTFRPGRPENAKNNSATIIIDSPEPGDWFAVVEADVTTMPPQGYALAISGPLGQLPP